MQAENIRALSLWGCRLVSFALSAGAVVGFMAGSLDVARWGYVQWFYGAVGFGLAAVLTAFISSAYASGSWLFVALAAAISIGLELSQALERADALQRSRASDSEVAKVVIGRLKDFTQTSRTPDELAAAEARLQMLRSGESTKELRQQLKQEVFRLKRLLEIEREGRAKVESDNVRLAQEASRDAANTHAGIRLMMSMLALSLEQASLLFALALVAAFQLAFLFVARRRADAPPVAAPPVAAPPVAAPPVAAPPVAAPPVAAPPVAAPPVAAPPELITVKDLAGLLLGWMRQAGGDVTRAQIKRAGPRKMRGDDEANTAISELVKLGLAFVDNSTRYEKIVLTERGRGTT